MNYNKVVALIILSLLLLIILIISFGIYNNYSKYKGYKFSYNNYYDSLNPIIRNEDYLNKHYEEKLKIYNMAKKKSKLTHKPLLVIGNPILYKQWNYDINKKDTVYGLGNKYISQDEITVLSKFSNDSYVIFVSDFIELYDIKDAALIIQHLIRISNKDIYIPLSMYFKDIERKTILTSMSPYYYNISISNIIRPKDIFVYDFNKIKKTKSINDIIPYLATIK